jgi:hypothetical protein
MAIQQLIKMTTTFQLETNKTSSAKLADDDEKIKRNIMLGVFYKTLSNTPRLEKS